MKKLIVLLLLPILVFGQSSEIRRPTADIDGGTSNWVVTHCQFGVPVPLEMSISPMTRQDKLRASIFFGMVEGSTLYSAQRCSTPGSLRSTLTRR
jgi:hypothetical protein